MKKSIALLLLMCMVLAGCGKTSTESGSDEVVPAENQSLKYGQVTKINGNEITIALAKEVSASDMQSQRGNKNNGASAPSATGDANASAGGTQPSNDTSQQGSAPSGENAQQGTAPSGDPSQGGGAPGGDGTAGGGTPPDMNGGGGRGDMSSSDSSTDSQNAPSASGSTDTSSSDRQNKTDKGSSSSNDSTQNRVMYQLTGEEETLTIPVGTAVVTSLGTTTTFSRIATDDTLKLLMQKNDAGEEVIVGVWIVA